MANKINRERLKAFLLRRKLNAFGLLILTILTAFITLICALTGFDRTDILATVTILLVILCFIQAIRMRHSFRTLRSIKGSPRRKKHD